MKTYWKKATFRVGMIELMGWTGIAALAFVGGRYFERMFTLIDVGRISAQVEVLERMCTP